MEVVVSNKQQQGIHIVQLRFHIARYLDQVTTTTRRLRRRKFSNGQNMWEQYRAVFVNKAHSLIVSSTHIVKKLCQMQLEQFPDPSHSRRAFKPISMSCGFTLGPSGEGAKKAIFLERFPFALCML